MKHTLIIFSVMTVIAFKGPQPMLTKKDSELWKTDSLGCLGKRKIIFSKILNIKNSFIGASESSIKKRLGKPNLLYKDSLVKRFYYFVERGPQCYYVNREGYDTLAVKELCVTFKKNKVQQISGMNP